MSESYSRLSVKYDKHEDAGSAPSLPYSSTINLASRTFSSMPALAVRRKTPEPGALPLKPTISRSEPTVTVTSCRRSHPLLDGEDAVPVSYTDLFLAAQILETIVTEGILVGNAVRTTKYGGFGSQGHLSGKEGHSNAISDRVLRLVYGTMKYLPYIDTIIIKTQFLVYNTDFLDKIALLKIMLFDLMKHHFDYKLYPGIRFEHGCTNAHATLSDSATTLLSPENDDNFNVQVEKVVLKLSNALKASSIRLSAAFARIRIEKHAFGKNSRERLEAILPVEVRQKESVAVGLPKTLRVNLLLSNIPAVLEALYKMDIFTSIQSEDGTQQELIQEDRDFADLLHVSPDIFATIQESTLMKECKLILQDKASVYVPRFVQTLVGEADVHVIDARAGCGTQVCDMAQFVGNGGKIIAVEGRASRLEALKANLSRSGSQGKVDIVPEDFLLITSDDSRAKEATVLVLEPPNSGTMIMDRLGYLLQEEDFPHEQITPKDLVEMKARQLQLLRHAFSFQTLQHIIYTTRSLSREENEDVVKECLQRYGDKWKLTCVLPNIVCPAPEEYEYAECLKVLPSDSDGNGVFIACFSKKRVAPDSATRRTTELTCADMDTQDKKSNRSKSKPLIRRPKWDPPTKGFGSSVKVFSVAPARPAATPFISKLNKKLKQSVIRLSSPRHDPVSGKSESSLGNKDAGSRTFQTPQDSSESLLELQSLNSPRERAKSRSGLLMSKSKGSDLDFSLIGRNLKKFYDPALEAVESLHPSTQRTWTFPVPNPIAWK